MAETFRFHSTLEALKVELQQLVRQREELEKKISSIRQSIMGLMALRDASVEDSEPVDSTALNLFPNLLASMIGTPTTSAKLTDLCRAAIKASAMPLTAAQVRHEVELMGFDFSGYESNPLSSIHTILRRLPEVQFSKLDGRTVYEWKPMSHSPLSGKLADELLAERESISTEAAKQFIEARRKR